MSQCLICSGWCEADPDTGYRADGICPSCTREGWQEGNGAVWHEPSPQADGHAEPMKSICCVCQAHLRGPVDATVISHGLCSVCYQKQLADLDAACPL